MTHNTISTALTGILDGYAPASIVSIGAFSDRVTTTWASRRPDVNVTTLAIDTPPAADLRAEFALVTVESDELPSGDGMALLARLRDLTVRRYTVVTVAPVADGWHRNDLAALALDYLGTFDMCERDPTPGALYGYDLRNYKRTPDWLNAEHWANPDRWDKERW